MSVTPICPDDLLLAARSGSLNLQDEARLSLHLQRCERCRAALDAGRAFDTVLGAHAGDDAIASRIAARVTGRPKRRWLGYSLAGAFLLTGSLSAAAVSSGAIGRWFVDVPEPAVVPPTVTRPSAPRATPKTSVPATEPLLDVEPPTSDVPTREEPAAPERPKRAATNPAASSKSAASLFAEANALRGTGSSAASKLYGELQRLFPNSTEAKVSLVSLARLELGSSPAQALRHFDAYLASGHTTLAEEALFGRASALGRLGRADQERAAWRRLVERFPSSVYAERAKARLGPAADP